MPNSNKITDAKTDLRNNINIYINHLEIKEVQILEEIALRLAQNYSESYNEFISKKEIKNINEKFIHVGRSEPDELIKEIDLEFPEFAGLCFYDKENKCLDSLEPEKVYFHYDPFHGVLRVVWA